ncbi:uncharacterized protein LOC141706454 isoform X1 [Apium graveolens]|uniref:uncharacterized protein LOC141706454 isoform X1 n=1 Tax=Apium graveolens TaxID=4045 RepID=UPI003D79FA1D
MSRWRESIENLKTIILIRGARDVTDLTAWIVAGTLVYYLDIVPAQQRKQHLKEKAARDARDPNRYIEKCKPIPDPQGLVKDFDRVLLVGLIIRCVNIIMPNM